MITTQQELLKAIGREIVIRQNFFLDSTVVKGSKSLSLHKKRAYLETVEDKRCAFCGSLDNLTVDHKLARSLGGTNEDTNLQILCQLCNVAKSAAETKLLYLLRSKNGKHVMAQLVNDLLKEVELLQAAGFPRKSKVNTGQVWVRTALRLLAERADSAGLTSSTPASLSPALDNECPAFASELDD